MRGAHGQVENINKALHFFDLVSVSSSFKAAGPDYDEADALISAALRFFPDRLTSGKHQNRRAVKAGYLASDQLHPETWDG